MIYMKIGTPAFGMSLILEEKESLKYGAPGAIRTPDRLVRSQVLYPAELQAQKTEAGLCRSQVLASS